MKAFFLSANLLLDFIMTLANQQFPTLNHSYVSP